MNPVTLAFRDQQDETAFLRVHGLRSLSIVRLSLVFAAILYTLYSILDYQLVPERAGLLLWVRVGGSLFLGVVAAFSTIRSARRYFQLTMSLVILVAGSGVIAIVTIVEIGGWYNYYGGVILAIIYAHALLRLRFIYASLTSWTLVCFYLLSALYVAGLPQGVLINNMFHLVSANILGMFASYGLEYNARAVFLKTKMLDESQARLAAEYERTTRELAAVREIQLSMLPQVLPEHRLVAVAAAMETAAEVGGDYYDLLVDGEDGLTFAIGDATGHGARAGAMVTAAKLLFSTHAATDGVAQFLERSSQSLRAMQFPRLYLTMAVGRIRGMTLEVAGAGMPPALLWREESAAVEHLSLKGLPLGSGFNGHYRPSMVQLSAGDVLVFMSDGLPELFNAQNCMMGLTRIEKALKAVAALPSQDILAHLVQCAADWRGEEPLRDDLTILVLNLRPGRNRQLQL